ncbi:hypothetical protein ACROYT_G014035 [Oculina patagonica]
MLKKQKQMRVKKQKRPLIKQITLTIKTNLQERHKEESDEEANDNSQKGLSKEQLTDMDLLFSKTICTNAKISMKTKNKYLKTFIEKTENFICRMRWKAYHFLNKTESTANTTYGFKSRKSPPQINELIPFEEDMTNLIQNIKFNDTKCSFQGKLNCDIKNKIKRSDTLLIPADKTTNFYAMNPFSYDKLIKENVTKTYKKSNDELVREIDAQSIPRRWIGSPQGQPTGSGED